MGLIPYVRMLELGAATSTLQGEELDGRAQALVRERTGSRWGCTFLVPRSRYLCKCLYMAPVLSKYSDDAIRFDE
jgi:hypothetical protein